ncbi:presqualene diphosphate synthase HpnD [Mycetohabitans sp. B4]|nr:MULTISPECIES: presqualene diphosphate synthase HpnD [Burkholderiaceae]MCG1019845.1 presqualene diphosphate synthase HpnD [Mycetohabitans sp. B4]
MTSQQVASGSSFYAAMRLLPRAQREGMYEIYSFCRQVDDIADSGASRESRLAALEQWRVAIAALYAGKASPPLTTLARVAQQFSLRQDDFIAVIDGMEMDVVDTIIAPDRNTLDLYCDRVASAVGRLSVKVFGMPDDDGRQLAHHLGRALQLTNILRDIDEDADIGRVYLPRDTLAAAGIVHPTPNAVRAASLDRACAPLIADAREHFAQATAIMARYPRRVVIAPRIMAQAYYALFAQLVRRGFAAPRERVRVSRARLMLAIARHWLF